MSIDLRSKRLEGEAGEKVPQGPSPRDPFRIVTQQQLISFGDRVTYTSVQGKEVVSIHFDRMRGEIFYKGHNVRHMELESAQLQALEEMRLILKRDSKTKDFAEVYGTLLDKILLERSRTNRSSP